MKNNSNSLFSTRMRLKMTQKDIADKLGVARNYVYLMESGRKPVTDTITQKLTELETAEVREPPAAYSTPADRPADRADASRLDDVVNRLDKMQTQIDTVIRLLGHRLK
jgi:transcriptional regulator with XRE-family HTH domain